MLALCKELGTLLHDLNKLFQELVIVLTLKIHVGATLIVI